MKEEKAIDKQFCIVCTSHEDSDIMKRAMEILDKNGYTICKKDALILNSEITGE